MVRIVIVGAGHAGVQLADSLRELGFSGDITLIGNESRTPYQRPPLTKEFLTAPTPDAGMQLLRAGSFFEANAIDLRLGREVISIDRFARRVVLDNGDVVRFDHLVLATGARSRPHAVVPPRLPRVHSIHRQSDAARFRAELDSSETLTIIGSGFIGMEVAAAARKMGIDVTVVSSKPPLSRMATPQLSEFLLEHHRDRGIRFIFDNAGSMATSRDGRNVVVTTIGGNRVASNLVLVAVGAVPNQELADTAELRTGVGILVDDYAMTSDRHIWAIGDCATRLCRTYGVVARAESVQAATHQAKCLARTLVGQPTQCSEVPWFWSNQDDLRIQIVGTPNALAHNVIRGDRASARFSVFSYEDGDLVGVESVNSPAHHLAARRILATGAPLSPDMAVDETFNLKAYSTKSERDSLMS